MVKKFIRRSLIAIITLGSILPVSFAFAGNDCASCVERKGRMCATECEKVNPERALNCQQRCIRDYCSHRCQADAPELKELISPDCDRCLERQYKLCEEHCTVGTGRERAKCQLDCSEERCNDTCLNSASAL